MKWVRLLFVAVLRKSVTLAALPSAQAVDQLVEDYHDTPTMRKTDACSN